MNQRKMAEQRGRIGSSPPRGLGGDNIEGREYFALSDPPAKRDPSRFYTVNYGFSAKPGFLPSLTTHFHLRTGEGPRF